MNIEQEISDLKRRMDATERGDFTASPFTTKLLAEFEAMRQQVAMLMTDYQERAGATKSKMSRREIILFTIAVGGFLFALFNRLTLGFR